MSDMKKSVNLDMVHDVWVNGRWCLGSARSDMGLVLHWTATTVNLEQLSCTVTYGASLVQLDQWPGLASIVDWKCGQSMYITDRLTGTMSD